MNATQLRYWEEQCEHAYHNAAFNYVHSVEEQHILKNLSDKVKDYLRAEFENKLLSDGASLIINYYDSGSVYIATREISVKVPIDEKLAEEDNIRKKLILLQEERDIMKDIVYSHPTEAQLKIVQDYIKANERHIGCA